MANTASTLARLTDEQVRDELVTRLVAKWGESEREESVRVARKLSRGLAANKIAHFDVDNIDKKWRAEAMRCLTRADWEQLKEGG